MRHALRPFRTTTTFSGIMTAGAFLGSFVRNDGALAALGCILACQFAIMAAAALGPRPGAAAWTAFRIETLSLPSYAAAVAGVWLALDRGLGARHAWDLVMLSGFFVLQGRLFVVHLAAELGGDRVVAPIRERVVVPGRSSTRLKTSTEAA